MTDQRYGLSEGTPSQKGLCIDAVTALDYVLAHSVTGKTKVIVSLLSAVPNSSFTDNLSEGQSASKLPPDVQKP